MNRKIKYALYSLMASIAVLSYSTAADEPTEAHIVACIDPQLRIVDMRSVANKAQNPNITAANLDFYYNGAKVTKKEPKGNCFDIGILNIQNDKSAYIALHFNYNYSNFSANREIVKIPVMTDMYGKTTEKKIEHTNYKVTVKWSCLAIEPINQADEMKNIAARAVIIQELYLEDN